MIVTPAMTAPTNVIPMDYILSPAAPTPSCSSAARGRTRRLGILSRQELGIGGHVQLLPAPFPMAGLPPVSAAGPLRPAHPGAEGL